MSMTATLTEAGHVILPDSVLQLFDLHGERQLEVDVVSDGVRLRLVLPRHDEAPKSNLWFTPFSQPVDMSLLQPETIAQAMAEDGF
jgi:bifunctional DNA-binding transcriptional regulator/antitoxin component of YhaV-PrlF toxin-antitoxin module